MRLRLLSLAFTIALVPLACNKSSDSSVTNAEKKVGAAADATAHAAKVKRDEFVSAMQTKLSEFDAKCKVLEERIKGTEGDAKKDLEKKLKVAKSKREVAAQKLDEAKGASHDRWEKIKDSVGNAFEDLNKAFE